jgi:hypothetical protein
MEEGFDYSSVAIIHVDGDSSIGAGSVENSTETKEVATIAADSKV